MSFLSKLFGKRTTGTAPQNEEGPRTYKEKDNLGTRQDTLSVATSYWMARMSSAKKDPFVMYTFDNGNDARAALLELPCIHAAEDTGKLICTEVLIFGYYDTTEGKYEALVCGDELTHELWVQAQESFAKHGGRKKNDLEPPKQAASRPKATSGDAGKVVFVREDREPRHGQTMTYRIHKGPDAASAKAFLENNPVSKQFYYIVVETPEGSYCRDIQGVYKE